MKKCLGTGVWGFDTQTEIHRKNHTQKLEPKSKSLDVFVALQKWTFFSDNFSTRTFAQCNTQFHLKLTANFPIMRQFWALKNVSLKECQNCVIKGVSTIVSKKHKVILSKVAANYENIHWMRFKRSLSWWKIKIHRCEINWKILSWPSICWKILNLGCLCKFYFKSHFGGPSQRHTIDEIYV